MENMGEKKLLKHTEEALNTTIKEIESLQREDMEKSI
jgi:hypothetical protein